MTTRNHTFLDQANPHGWYRVSVNLHEQAVLLHEQTTEFEEHINYETGERTTRRANNQTAFLLGGFALENALKAFLVHQNPQWISNGRLCRNLKTHRLTQLNTHLNNIATEEGYLEVLSSFEAGIDSWARYPCSLRSDDTTPEGVMTSQLWENYELLITAYHSQLRGLLSDGWQGPDGYYARFEFR